MELRRQCLKKYGNRIFILFFLLILLVDCKRYTKFGTTGKNYPSGKGFILQRFDILNPHLDNIIRDIEDSVELKNMGNIILLSLVLNNSTDIELGISLVYMDNIAKQHIFNSTQRIVGYITWKNNDLIVLSNVRSQFDFEVNFYKFIKPTLDTKYFDYIYFPSDLYQVDEKGIPLPPLLYDPHYYWYSYKDGEFIFQEDFHDLKGY